MADSGQITLQQALLALRKIRSRLEEREARDNEPIAVIGFGCRLPGGVNNGEDFWRLLEEGVDAITEIPADRFDVDRFYSEDPDADGKMYTRRGGFIDDVAAFDAHFFDIPPDEADRLDPQQRLLLEVAWEAFENAGVPVGALAGTNTGVFVGGTQAEYATLMRDSGLIDSYTTIGTAGSGLAGRLSYLFGLQGPSVTVDTACSSSLVAVHLASQSLRAQECRIALAGGVNLLLAPEKFIAACKARMLSSDGSCKTFDADADGYARSEGCGVIVLKRLSDALHDRDAIVGLIRGSAVNQDGHSSGFTAPSGRAQQALIRTALTRAGVSPAQLQYVEAHGAGSALGDPIEVEALAAVLREGRDEANPFILGSVKTNIGHLELAAGICGLIKVLLSFQREMIPPHLHLRRLNPHIAWDAVPGVVATSPQPWPRSDEPRLASVSSFGFTGTNSCVVLQDAPPVPDAEPGPRAARPAHILTLSARTDKALSALAERYAGYLEDHPDSSLAPMCFSANTGRTHLEHRAAVVAESSKAMRDRLLEIARQGDPAGTARGHVGPGGRPKVAFLFTGQGSQYPGMAKELYAAEPLFRARLDHFAGLLRDFLPQPLLPVMFEEDARLFETEYAQPALFALECSLVDLWRSWGIEPDFVAGHSLGEYAAACTAGMLDVDDAAILVAKRGRLMQNLPVKGAAAAVFANEQAVAAKVARYEGDAVIAAVNAPERILVSGKIAAVQAVVAEFVAEGVEAKVMVGLGGAHSPLMDPTAAEFAELGQTIRHSSGGRVGMVSSLLGRLIRPHELDHRYWWRQVREPVRFVDTVLALKRLGCKTFLEIGPRHTLLRLAEMCVEGTGEEDGDAWLPSLGRERNDSVQMLEALGGLYARGAEPSWVAVTPERGRTLALPTYPFQRKRHWFHKGVRRAGRQSSWSTGATSFLGSRLKSASRVIQYQVEVSLDAPSWLHDHRPYGAHVVPGAGHLTRIIAAGLELFARGIPQVKDVVFPRPLLIASADDARSCQLLLTPDDKGDYAVEIASASLEEGDQTDDWIVHAFGRLENVRAEAPASGATHEDLETEISDSEHYSALDAVGHHLGERFRWVRRVTQRDGEAWGMLRAPTPEEAREPAIHPGLLDSCFQVASRVPLAAAPLASDAIYVPFSLDTLRFHARPSGEVMCHVKLRADQTTDELRTADVRLFEAGKPIVELLGLQLRKVPRDKLLRDDSERSASWFHELVWEQAELGAAASQRVAGTWLVFSDGHLGATVSAALRERGAEVIEVGRGEPYSLNDGRAVIEPLDAKQFERLIDESSRGADLCGAVYLWGAEIPGDTTDTSAAHQVTAGLLHLTQALVPFSKEHRGDAGGVKLKVVTRGAQAVGPDEVGLADSGSVLQTPLWGIGRTIANEHPEVWGGLVDVDPLAGDDSARVIFRELAAPDTAVAYRGPRRYLARLRRAVMPARPPLTPVADATYLITGGTGAIGESVVRWLAASGARHLLLVGRSDRPSTQELRRELLSQGVRVEFRAGDVSQESDMARILGEARREMPPLRGLIHAAGVVDDGPVLRQDKDRLERVMAPKVDGALVLHNLLRADQLDFCLFFSSVSALFGIASQATYAAANAFLDGLAVHRRRLGLPATSVAWGAWEGTGMASGLGDQIYRRWGIRAFSPSQGVEALGRLLGRGHANLTVIRPDWAQFAENVQSPALTQLMSALVAGPVDVPDQVEANDFLSRWAVTDPETQYRMLNEFVVGATSRLLGRDEHEFVGFKGRLGELGVDSMLSIDLLRYLRHHLKMALPSTLIFERPTIDGLVEYLHQQLTAAKGAESR